MAQANNEPFTNFYKRSGFGISEQATTKNTITHKQRHTLDTKPKRARKVQCRFSSDSRTLTSNVADLKEVQPLLTPRVLRRASTQD